VSAYACNPVTTEAAFPGEALVGWNLTRQLGRFHDVCVLTRAYNRPALERALKQKDISGVRFVYVDLPYGCSVLLRNFFGFRVYYLFWQIKAYFVARALHRQFQFEVFHHITFNNDWMPSFIGAFLPVPFIWGPIGGGQKVPVALWGELARKDRITEYLRNTGQIFWRKSLFRRRCVRRASAILVCNRETEKGLALSKNKIHSFPVNGIAREEFLTTKTPRSSHGEFRILYAGRLDPIKGIHLGIQAFSSFYRAYPDSRMEIVGDGPCEAPLKALVERLSLTCGVRFVPWLSRESLLERMSDSDVLLFPSFRDGGGAVVVEAMACGLPVICLDTAGPAFHVQDAWGIKIRPDDPNIVVMKIVEALKRLYGNIDLRKGMGLNACRRAHEYYLWERRGEHLQEIYQTVIQAESPTGATSPQSSTGAARGILETGIRA